MESKAIYNLRNKQPKQLIEKSESSKNEIEPNKNIINSKQNLEENELKIELFPKNVPKGNLEKRLVSSVLPKDLLGHSFNKNQSLAFPMAKVPILCGFYTAHCKHFPLRLKPDDIWLLIVQAFSNHVNKNSEILRQYFVNFENKKSLEVIYPDKLNIKDVDKKTLEDFAVQINEQMKKYLGEEIIKTLTSDFSTTNYDSLIISKLSIMGAFKSFFNYHMGLCICGIPYIILEGTAEDYKKIKEKAEKLSKYKFDWYIDRIIPHILKMIEAKVCKVDNDYFRNIIIRNEVKGYISGGCLPSKDAMISEITGWILDFFAYEGEDDSLTRFNNKSLEVQEFNRLASQILTAPFTIKEIMTGKTYKMNYSVGFFGCEQNEKKEVSPFQAWIVSPSPLKDKDFRGFEDPIPPKLLDNSTSKKFE